MTKRLTTLLATIVLGTTLLGSGANAAVLATGTETIAAIPADAGPDRHGWMEADRSRTAITTAGSARSSTRCSRASSTTTLLTREQKLRIMDAFNCVPDATTDKPSTTRPTTAPPAASVAPAPDPEHSG